MRGRTSNQVYYRAPRVENAKGFAYQNEGSFQDSLRPISALGTRSLRSGPDTPWHLGEHRWDGDDAGDDEAPTTAPNWLPYFPFRAHLSVPNQGSNRVARTGIRACSTMTLESVTSCSTVRSLSTTRQQGTRAANGITGQALSRMDRERDLRSTDRCYPCTVLGSPCRR